MKLPLLHTALIFTAALSSLLGTSSGAPCTLVTDGADVQLEACPGDAPSQLQKTAIEVVQEFGGKKYEGAKRHSDYPLDLNYVLSRVPDPLVVLYERTAGPPPPPPLPPPPPAPKAGSSSTGPGLRLKIKRPPSINEPPTRDDDIDPKFKKNPANLEPGSGAPQDTPPIRSVATIESAGRRQWEAYKAAIKTHTRDTQIVQDKSQLPANPGAARAAFLDVRNFKGYQITSAKIGNPTQGRLKAISLFRTDETSLVIKNTEAAQEIQIVPIADASKSIVKMTVDAGGRYFIMQDSFKATDQTGSGIPLNEMVMQNFLHVAGTNADKFAVMFIVNIQNREFWNVVRASYDERKKSFKQVLTFKAEKDEDKAIFDRFMGTPNISSKLFGFQNHYIALGKKSPRSIVVYPQQGPGADELSIALVFVDPPNHHDVVLSKATIH